MKALLAALLFVFFAAGSTTVLARAKTLEGYWKGGGSFVSASGTKERTRCRATFRARKRNRFAVFARCAIASLGTIEQTGIVRRTGRNRYAGRFTNEEYDISGRIYIVLRGSKQYITLRSSKGRGHLTLRRRH